MDAIKYGQVMLTEGEFSIKAGIFSYFIVHDVCGTGVYSVMRDRTPGKHDWCRRCYDLYGKKIQYDEKMTGIVALLDWKDEGDSRDQFAE
jgi:hypothetical protein